jgi:patatin-like phospholipase
MTDGQLALVLLLVLGFFLALAGCSSRKCREPAQGATARSADDARALASSLARAAETPGPIDVLVISGGGSHGAYGAGLLAGWRHAESPRPPFAVVTGVSTGALLATHALLGTIEDDASLERLYTTTTDADVFDERSALSLPFADSLASLEPLRQLIAREITDATIDRVAHAVPRRIFVATTNLDNGRLKIWDLTALAEAREYERYRLVLLASSAVPALYPPVEIDGQLHADGGVREQLFVRKIMLELMARMAVTWHMPKKEGEVRVPTRDATVHVLLNGKLSVAPTCVQPDILSLAQRAVEILASAAAVGNLHMSKAVADEAGAAWRLARISEAVSIPFGAQTFDPAGMRALYEEGFSAGRGGRWETSLPEIEDSARGIEP